MKNRYIKLLLLLFIATQAIAQAPAIEWQKTYGGAGQDYAYQTIRTSDGGYAIAGSTTSNNGDVTGNHGTDDFWVVKLNSSGILQWQKTFGGSNSDFAYSIIQTTDGGYAIAGSTTSNDGDVSGNHGFDMWVVKLNSSGIIQWQKTFGGSFSDIAYSIIQTTDGGYAIAGGTTSNDGNVSGNHGEFDMWVVKLNSSGIIQWQKTFGGSFSDFASSLIQTTDGGYAIAGYTWSIDGDVSGNHGDDDMWVVKLNSLGILQWQKTFGGSNYDFASSLSQTTDGGYAIIGHTYSNNGDVSGNHGESDIWLIKLSSLGILQWQKTFGGSFQEYVYINNYKGFASITQTTDGGYAIAGTTASNDGDVTENHGYVDMWMVKLNSLGTLEWQKTFGGLESDYVTSIIQTTDGGYAIAGYTWSIDGDVTGNQGYSDIWVVKLSPPPFAIFPGKKMAICQTTTTLYAQGCTGAVNWYRDTNGAGTTYESLGTGNPKTITLNTNLEQFYRAKCTFFSNDLYGYSNYAVVRTGPVLTPQTYFVLPTVSKTFTASGCPAGTTYVWQHAPFGPYGPNITKTGTIHSLYPATYFVKCESEDCTSPSGYAYLYTADIAANPDNYTLNIDRPYTGNFTDNDGVLSPKQIFIEPQPKYGYLSYDNSGAFLYTPLAGFKGIDSFEYYFTNSVGSFSNYGKVTLNVICPTVFPLTSPLDDTITGLGIYKASSTSGTISATNKITGTAKVTYQAKIIELNAGFKADNGTVFTAEIGGCL